ncbi:MAG: hypothetical protein CMN30_01860 [Sandaracinus sp.]|nr:hypothetical protein [Sandaracinus sp.]
MRRALGFALVLALGCTPDPQPTPGPDPTPDTTGGGEEIAEVIPAEPGAPELTTAVGRGATPEEALTAARQAFREAVLGPWGRDAPVELFDPAHDEVVTEEGAGGHQASIRLERARGEALLAALPQLLPQPGFSSAPLARLQEAAVANFVCDRRQALLADESCERTELEPLLREANEAVRALRLEPLWDGGVPVAAEAGPVRKPAVRLVRDGEPVTAFAGLPLVAEPMAEGEGEAVRGAIDARGLALLEVDLAEPQVVTLDRAGLVPPLGSIFGELRTPLTQRRVDGRRWALVLTGAADPARDAFAAALGTGLRSRGARVRRPLEPRTRRALLDARGRGAALRALADAERGALDVVLVAEVESHFASRMGTRRVWYEATANLKVYSAWTGQPLTELTARANANGIGDERAEAAAREQVAQDLVRQLAAIPALALGSSAARAQADHLRLARR